MNESLGQRDRALVVLADGRLEPPAASTAQAEQDLRKRLTGKVRHGRLWSIGATEEQPHVDRSSRRSSAASALGQREFTFAMFHQLAADLLGYERATVFAQLPARLQAEAWRDLGERTRARTDELFRGMRDEC
jgi:hypothetical protein